MHGGNVITAVAVWSALVQFCFADDGFDLRLIPERDLDVLVRLAANSPDSKLRDLGVHVPATGHIKLRSTRQLLSDLRLRLFPSLYRPYGSTSDVFPRYGNDFSFGFDRTDEYAEDAQQLRSLLNESFRDWIKELGKLGPKSRRRC